MKDLRFKVWHLKENKMYFRGYQKFLHALLCEDDKGANSGNGKPVRRASYADCVFLESTGLRDKNNQEIFEGDIVRIRYKDREFQDIVEYVPDTFGVKVHPLQTILKKQGIIGDSEKLEIEILGNEYETPELAKEIAR
jgi:uncharacterized phage protein (TIGR01671 family)